MWDRVCTHAANLWIFRSFQQRYVRKYGQDLQPNWHRTFTNFVAPLELRLVFLLLNRGTPLILSSTLSANAVQVDDSLLFVWEHCVAYYDYVLYAEKAASSLSKRHVAQACNIGETLEKFLCHC